MKNYLHILLALFVLQIQPVQAGEQNQPAQEAKAGTLVYEPVFKSQFFIHQVGEKNRDTIILIHGLGTLGGKEWKPIATELISNYHVVVIDLPGFARSDKKNLLYSPENYAHFIKWIIDQYAHDTVTLIGHSMGGAIALYTAAAYPQSVQKLVLIDAAGILNRTILLKFMAHLEAKSFPEILLKPFYFGINQASSALLNALDTESKPDDIEKILSNASSRSSVLDGNPTRIAALALINTNFSRLLDKVTMPTLIIWGEKDGVAPLRTGKMLSYRLENARLKIIKGAEHATITKEPEIIIDYIKSFLQSGGIKPERQIPEKTERRLNCYKKKDVVFSGHYLSINIKRCKRVRLVNVSTNRLSISGSNVIIENSRLQGDYKTLNIYKSHVTIEGGIISGDVALKAVRSFILLTGVRLQGNIAIVSQSSTLDIAGVLLKGTEAAIHAIGKNTLQASVSQAQSPHGTKYMHGSMRLSPKQDL